MPCAGLSIPLSFCTNMKNLEVGPADDVGKICIYLQEGKR
jgi:hypothetical protein